SLAKTIGLSSWRDPNFPTGRSRSRYARSADTGGTNFSRGISSNADWIRKSVTSAVRTWPSTMLRRAAAKSDIVSLAEIREKPCLVRQWGRKGKLHPEIVARVAPLYGLGSTPSPYWPRGGVVTQRTANP